MCYFGGQRGRPEKTWKEVANEDVNDLNIKPSDAVDCSKNCEMINRNRVTVTVAVTVTVTMSNSDSNSGSDSESNINSNSNSDSNSDSE